MHSWRTHFWVCTSILHAHLRDEPSLIFQRCTRTAQFWMSLLKVLRSASCNLSHEVGGILFELRETQFNDLEKFVRVKV